MQLDLSDLKVTYKAVGFDGVIAATELPEATLIAAMTYGIRRMIQDSCNSQAAKLREERKLTKEATLPESDRRTIHDARLGAMKDGTIGMRSVGESADVREEEAMLAFFDAKVSRMGADAIKAAKKLKRAEKLEKVATGWEALKDEYKAPHYAHADLVLRAREEARIAAAKARAEAKAAAASIEMGDDDGFELEL